LSIALGFKIVKNQKKDVETYKIVDNKGVEKDIE
jgi:hypothetical protein